jgi:hypothetical protein
MQFDHRDVAGSLNNLELLYRVPGRFADAEPSHKRALAIQDLVQTIPMSQFR